MGEQLVLKTLEVERFWPYSTDLPPFDEETDVSFCISPLPAAWGLQLQKAATPWQAPLGEKPLSLAGCQITAAYQQQQLAGYIAYVWHEASHLVQIIHLRSLPDLRESLGGRLLAVVQDYVRTIAARGVYLEAFNRQVSTIELCLAAGFDLWGLGVRSSSPLTPILGRGSVQLGKANLGAIPTARLCHRLMAAYRLPAGIVHHSALVERVACLLADEMIKGGITVDRRLVSAGALLHDIGKAVDGSCHHLASRKIVEQEGYPLLGPIVERHLTTLILTASAPSSWEEKLVSYADKVCTQQIVTLDERFADLNRRYQDQAAAMTKALPALRLLEEEIFSSLPWCPDQLSKRVSASAYDIPSP